MIFKYMYFNFNDSLFYETIKYQFESTKYTQYYLEFLI